MLFVVPRGGSIARPLLPTLSVVVVAVVVLLLSPELLHTCSAAPPTRTRIDLSSAFGGFSSTLRLPVPSTVASSENTAITYIDDVDDDENTVEDDDDNKDWDKDDTSDTIDQEPAQPSLVDLPLDILNRIYCRLADKDFGSLLRAGKNTQQHICNEHLETLHRELCELAQDPHPSALRRIVAVHMSPQSKLLRALMQRRCDGRSILWVAMKAGNIPFLRWMVDTKYYTANAWIAFVKHAQPFLKKYRNTPQATALQQFIRDTDLVIPRPFHGVPPPERFQELKSMLLGDPRRWVGVNVRNVDGKTPLHEAAQYAQSDIARALVARGANPRSDSFGSYSPVQLAARNSDYETMKVLLDGGGDPDEFTIFADDRLPVLLLAASVGNVDTVQALVDGGASLKPRDMYGNNALMRACGQRSHMHEGTVDVLLAAGADVNAQNEYGDTALILAASMGSYAMVRSLLKFGAERYIKNKDGQEVICYAQRSYDQALIDLLRNGADSDGRRPCPPATMRKG